MYKVSVPGSLMIFGEHAVLHDKMAIAAAVDKRITASLTLRDDQIINISSPVSSLQTTLNSVEVDSQLRFVTAAIKKQIKTLTIRHGFDLHIETEFSHEVGLGSSAAVTIATVLLLDLAYDRAVVDPMKLFLKVCQIIREVQGIGSCADVAASIFGGVILYKMSPVTIEKIADTLPLAVIYSGKKMPTAEVVAIVRELYNELPQILSLIFDAIDECVRDAADAIKATDWRKLGKLMNVHHGLQDALSVNDEVLAELIFSLRKQPTIYGAKISGSGLGDCVIGLGEVSRSFNSNQIDVVITSEGINYKTNE